jgi:hypothetical protein
METIMELLARNLAYVITKEDHCLCPPAWICDHLITYRLMMCDVDGNEQEVTIWDSETIGNAYNAKLVTR